MMRKKKKREYFVSCIMAAGGKGTRMGESFNKLFLELDGIPILAHTLLAFEENDFIDEIILVTGAEDLIECKNIVEDFELSKVKTIVIGGKERQDSVYRGLAEVDQGAEVVLIHDGARPLIEGAHIEAVVSGVLAHGAAAVGAPCKNTIKEVDQEGFIRQTLDREYLFEVQTPQGFKREWIQNAYADAMDKGISATDDCFLVERMGLPIQMVKGSSDNIKITTYEDLLLAEQILDKRK